MEQPRNGNLMKTFGTCHFYPSASHSPISIDLPFTLFTHKQDSTEACIHLKYTQNT